MKTALPIPKNRNRSCIPKPPIVLGLIFFVKIALGADTYPPALTNYIQHALDHNPGIKSAYNDWQAAIREIPASRRLPNPSLSFGAFLQSVETAVGPQEFRLGLSQQIPWFGKRKLQGDIQAQQAAINQQQLRNISNVLRMKVIQVYYDYYLLRRSIAITQQNVDLLRQWETLVQSKYTSAQKSYGDLVKAQIEIRQLEDNLQTLLKKEPVIIEKFRSLLNDKELNEIELPDSLPLVPKKISIEQVRNMIRESNPKLKSAAIMITLREAVVKRHKLDYLPNFGIGADYIFTGDKYQNGTKVAASGKDPFAVGVSLSLPIWHKKQKAEIESARGKFLSSTEALHNLENQLESRASELLYQLNDADRKIHLFSDELIPKSIELLSVNETAYTTGNVDFLSLIDAQRRYLQFLLDYEKSIVRYMQLIAELEFLIGRSL